MRLNKTCIILIVLSLSFLFVSCSQQNESIQLPDQQSTILDPNSAEGEKPSDVKKIRMGVSLLSFDNEFILGIKDAMEAQAEQLGVEIIIDDGQNSAEKQVSQVENYIAKKVDVIILNPASYLGCEAAVEAANGAGIPIMTVNTLVVNQDKCITFVGSDAIESGRLEMEYAARMLNGKGNIVILHGQNGHDAEIGRRKGAQEVLDAFPQIKVLYEQSGNWARAEGEAIIENLLQLNKPIDAIVSQNDEMALGAIKALENARKLDRVLVFGIDAISEALQAVKSGKMKGTVFQDAKSQGTDAIDVAYKIARKEKVEKTIYIPYVLLTNENLDKYLNY